MHMLDPPTRFSEPAILGRVVRHLLTAPFRNKMRPKPTDAEVFGKSSSSKAAIGAAAAAGAVVRSGADGRGGFDLGVNI
jgi:hypothetical protein